MKTITHAELKQILVYDPETGLFTRACDRKPRYKKGQIAGTPMMKYIQIRINGKPYLAHRLAWFYVYEYFPKELDHINGNGCDNRIANLRECSRSENLRNIKRTSNNTSGYKGVSWSKSERKWKAVIGVNGKALSLGRFDDPEEAYKAYCEAAIRYHGDFANLG